MTVKLKTRLESPQKGWLFLNVPDTMLGTRKRVWLKGTFNGRPFVGTANPWKNDTHRIAINRLMRRQLGIDGPVDVELEFDISEQPLLDVEIPMELRRALETDKTAWGAFWSLAPAHQKEFIFYIDEARGAMTRKRRTEISLAILRRNRRLYEDPSKRFSDDLKADTIR